MLLNCGVGDLRIPWTAKRSNQSILKEINLNIHWKDWYWSWYSNALAFWCEELTYWKRPWCWKRLKAGGEGDDRGWDDWMASLTQWTWVWVDSWSWWWTGRPGILWFMGSQRVRHDWATELNWTKLNRIFRKWLVITGYVKWLRRWNVYLKQISEMGRERIFSLEEASYYAINCL